MFIFYGVIPALIIFLWYNAIQSWQRLGITSIADIIYLLFIFIVAPIGYGYFLWKRKQPNKTRKSNLESLVNDLFLGSNISSVACPRIIPALPSPYQSAFLYYFISLFRYGHFNAKTSN